MSAAARRIPWSRDELIVVCGLYFTLPFGQMHARNPRIIDIAQRLGRTPSSIAMKLVNFASLDPAHRARGIRGLGGCSRADEQMWEEFRENWDQMMILSETKLRALPATVPNGATGGGTEYVPDACATEAEATVMVRTVQGVFRKVVLAAYNSTCCISEIPIPEPLALWQREAGAA